MTEYSEKGLTLRWGAPDLVPGERRGLGPRILVAARPAHPSNVVTAIYTIDGGATRIARGHRLPAAARPCGEEWFAIDLPPQADGALMAFLPLLSRSGREADPRRGGVSFTPLMGSPAPAATPAAEPPRPAGQSFAFAMELLTRVTAPLVQPPTVIGETAQGLRIAFDLDKGGSVRGPRLNGSILHSGGDWMLVRRDGIGLSDARILIKTDEGALVMGEYGGVVDFGPDGHELLINGRGPKQAAVQMTPRYVTSAASLNWLNRLQCIALGRVTLSTLLVEYDVYAMCSRAADNG
jgi:Protein of unknown function (DUF3237)